MKDLLISFALIFGPLAVCCAVFHRTIRRELANMERSKE
jgi:hypothetical protein